MKSNIRIRKMKYEDLDALAELLANEEVMRFLEPPFTRERAARFLNEQGLIDEPRVYAVANGEELFIGYVIYHEYDAESMEIGWVLCPDYWGHGIATELTKQLVERAFLEVKNVVIECVPEHEATKHIAEKCNFEYIGEADGLCIYKRQDA